MQLDIQCTLNREIRKKQNNNNKESNIIRLVFSDEIVKFYFSSEFLEAKSFNLTTVNKHFLSQKKNKHV